MNNDDHVYDFNLSGDMQGYDEGNGIPELYMGIADTKNLSKIYIEITTADDGTVGGIFDHNTVRALLDKFGNNFGGF
jgi:hypothetical protein